MRKFVMAVCIVLFLTGIALAEEATPFKDQKDKISYSLGVTIGKSMKRDMIDVNPEVFAQGMKDVFSGGKILLTEEEMMAVFMALQQELTAKKAEAKKALAEKNAKEGEQFPF